ncbi:uncharacterized protein LOC129944929 [Eupeodes corollae]|uniref:uncharacterized protein LOC129944929 n=1 Tax=Eupeodes corollae TaxID=290404 RepID=UPI002491A7A0|nr:uncharacterized protein LOC129944929 [Eupeodes corollae]
MCMMEDTNFMLELIEVYRSLPVLWNIKSKEYSNRYLKNEQYEMLLLKYKEKYPEATKKDVTQKINVLRTNYRRDWIELDETQRIFAKKFINDILFEGQMGTLHRNAMHLNVESRPSTSYQASYSRSAPGSSSFLEMPISPNIQSSPSEFLYANENLSSVSPQNIIEVWESTSELAVEFSPQNTEVSRYFSSFK